MSSFTTPLIIKENGDGTFTLMASFMYYLNDPDGEYVEVPEGYTTDFASVPKAFHWLLPPYHPDYGKAAVVHDYLCSKRLIKRPGNGSVRLCPRVEADLIFYQAAKVLGSPAWKRSVMWAAVRLYAVLAGKK